MERAIQTDLVGQLLGGTYRVERKIGQGGMGAVYEASHVRVPRRFAIKMLHLEALEDEKVFQRFRREAEIASSVGHDNIVQVFDFNQTPDGIPFMVLEFLEGEDLQNRLRRKGKLSIGETLALLEQIAGGLEAAHGHGIVHRDLKPANLFLCPQARGGDRVKILDFGISKITNSSSMATRNGAIMGTPNYMSPEQADGRIGEIDSRTDVFALGCILFECLTGKLPFEGPTMMGTIYQIVMGEPESIDALAPELPEGIKRAVMHCLQKDLTQRTQSVTALLAEFVAGYPPPTVVSAQRSATPEPYAAPIPVTPPGYAPPPAAPAHPTPYSEAPHYQGYPALPSGNTPGESQASRSGSRRGRLLGVALALLAGAVIGVLFLVGNDDKAASAAESGAKRPAASLAGDGAIQDANALVSGRDAGVDGGPAEMARETIDASPATTLEPELDDPELEKSEPKSTKSDRKNRDKGRKNPRNKLRRGETQDDWDPLSGR